MYVHQATECVLRDYHYSRAGKPVPVETAEPLNLVEMYVADEFAGNPFELEEEEESALTDDDKEALGQVYIYLYVYMYICICVYVYVCVQSIRAGGGGGVSPRR